MGSWIKKKKEKKIINYKHFGAVWPQRKYQKILTSFFLRVLTMHYCIKILPKTLKMVLTASLCEAPLII